jgi:hypothetical protein
MADVMDLLGDDCFDTVIKKGNGGNDDGDDEF